MSFIPKKRDLKRVWRLLSNGIRPSWHPHSIFLSDFTDENISIIREIKNFTMTPPERINALIESVRYVIKNNIPGTFVECGVWKGGSMMAIARVLQLLKADNRDLYLFDTFSGMTPPTEKDIPSLENKPALQSYQEHWDGDHCRWAYSSLEETKKNILSTGYPKEKIHFIVGPVEKTLPLEKTPEICLLRLDTDFYDSTAHELQHLFPHLTKGGVLILDDYGHWEGQKLAADEYLENNKIPLLLNRIDCSCRIGIKL